jgi:hypothetical protein
MASAATFVNHKSKISTLRSQMLAICRDIDESLGVVSTAASATTTVTADATMPTTTAAAARLEGKLCCLLYFWTIFLFFALCHYLSKTH